MATFKRVMLTETDNSVTEKSSFMPSANNHSVKKQLDKFDNTYTSKKLNELYSEFDAITFNTPTVSANNLSEVMALTEQSSVSFKTKLYLTSAILVTLLLAFLAIYNVFVINGLNAGIKLLQEEVTQTTAEYDAIYNYNSQLQDQSVIADKVSDMGFVDVSSNYVINIPLMETVPLEETESSTNWFNEFCNFIKGVFGGK